jgi:hypothetical protein
MEILRKRLEEIFKSDPCKDEEWPQRYIAARGQALAVDALGSASDAMKRISIINHYVEAAMTGTDDYSKDQFHTQLDMAQDAINQTSTEVSALVALFNEFQTLNRMKEQRQDG